MILSGQNLRTTTRGRVRPSVPCSFQTRNDILLTYTTVTEFDWQGIKIMMAIKTNYLKTFFIFRWEKDLDLIFENPPS